MIGTPILGTVALIVIRFSINDRQLAKNIFLSVVIISLLWFLYPFIDLLIGTILSCTTCPESTFKLTQEVIFSSFVYAVRSLIPGVACGFVFAFFIVVPITLLFRQLRRKSDTDESTLVDDSHEGNL